VSKYTFYFDDDHMIVWC